MTKERELLARAFDALKNRTLITATDRKLEKELSYYLLSTNESTPPPFIRLTEEEIKTLADSGLSPDWTDEFELYHFARSVEDALEEKNK